MKATKFSTRKTPKQYRRFTDEHQAILDMVANRVGWKDIAKTYGVTTARARDLYQKIKRFAEYKDKDPYYGLSTRASNVLFRLGLETKTTAEIAWDKGDLSHKLKTGPRNHGQKTETEIGIWLGKITSAHDVGDNKQEPNAKRKDGWIDLKEEKPAKNIQVIVCDTDGTVTEFSTSDCYHENHGCVGYKEHRDFERVWADGAGTQLVAWRPKPQPPYDLCQASFHLEPWIEARSASIEISTKVGTGKAWQEKPREPGFYNLRHKETRRILKEPVFWQDGLTDHSAWPNNMKLPTKAFVNFEWFGPTTYQPICH